MGKERQEYLPGGIEKFSRSAMYKKKGAFKKLGKVCLPCLLLGSLIYATHTHSGVFSWSFL